MATPTSPAPATLARTPRQKLLQLAILTVLLAAAAIQQLRRHPSSDPAVEHQAAGFVLYFWLTIGPLYALACCEVLLPARVELGETALVVRRPFRRRRVLAWRGIQSLRVDQRGSRCRVAIYGDDPDGRHVVLPAPYSGFPAKDPQFREKFLLLEQAWVERRGDDWELLPLPQPGHLSPTSR